MIHLGVDHWYSNKFIKNKGAIVPLSSFHIYETHTKKRTTPDGMYNVYCQYISTLKTKEHKQIWVIFSTL